MRTIRFFLLLFVIVTMPLEIFPQYSNSWTHFRGSRLNALAEPGNYPVHWNDSTNIIWKTELNGRAWSSPVVLDNRIWCTNANVQGTELSMVCIDYKTGNVLYNQLLFSPGQVFRKHAVNSYATPTPCVEKDFVYVHFGRYGTACIESSTGKKVWERTDLQCEHVQGPGSSLVLFKDKLIVHMEGTDTQFIYALDKRTGEVIWKSERPQEYYNPIDNIGKKAYITPIIISVNGRELLISNGSAVCQAFDIETGEEVWRIPQGVDSTISMPVVYDGIVYFYTSFVVPPEGEKYCELLAVDPNGMGDISETNIIWRVKSPILQLLTPVIYNKLLFTIDSESNLICLDALSGKEIWTDKLKGKFHSSPVIANEKLYFNSTRGDGFVYNASKEKLRLSENKLPGEIWATPVFLDGSMVMRTSEYLYRFAE